MLNDLDYNDKATWQLFAEGKTKGIFQLESNLGKSWAKKLAPTNIEELSALIAIIRPGTLKAYVDGKSMTQHYVDRKHGREEVTYLHPALEDILKTTYGVLVYQEQSMRIAEKIAGFNLQEADVLRKAIGKKKADLMNEVKKSFIAGAERVGIVTKEEAEQISAGLRNPLDMHLISLIAFRMLSVHIGVHTLRLTTLWSSFCHTFIMLMKSKTLIKKYMN
ncbi:MAG: hypothetical protein EB127_17160 [Alphaproteobacteria bacterium]|nr:hypothetical protein [Alphaproteobacteria bacterium]